MEFLTTYGWVILVVAVAVLVLNYSGVLSNLQPRAPPNECAISRPNGPGSDQFLGFVGPCPKEVPQFVATFNPRGGTSNPVGNITVAKVKFMPDVSTTGSLTLAGWVYIGPHGCQVLLHDRLGGFTQQVRNPDSWEGWYWGSMHVWGTGAVGMMRPSDNTMKDITEHCDLALFWGGDPETTPWGNTGQLASRLLYFWTDAGIKQVYIQPELNYAAAIHADKWIPVLPNTDAALQLAIIYLWLQEGTYDKEYVKTHTVGLDKIADYVNGKEDGIAKTPAWAATKCGVPEWTIKALARESARQVTSIIHYFGGGMIRGPYSHEPARLEVVLLGMMGLGKPGVHQASIAREGMPRDTVTTAIRAGIDVLFHACDMNDRIRRPHCSAHMTFAKQIIPKTLVQEAILNPPVTFWGRGEIRAQVEDQFVKYTYPIPKEEGGTEIHMIWSDTPCRTTCWNDGNKTILAMRSPKIETIVVQHPWLENDCMLSDIILPSNTTFEVEDIVTNVFRGAETSSVTYQKRAIQPIGESMSDYEIVLEIAKKLGKYEEITQGKSIEEWIKVVYERLEMQKHISWEDFKKKQYFVFPTAEDWDQDPPGLRLFYQDPKKNPLPTPSGKLEFYSERLAQNFPDDQERPPIPKWIEKGITHDEALTSVRAHKYPLLVMSNHGRWRMHAQGDDISWTREALTCKVTGADGYKYEPLWINPRTADCQRYPEWRYCQGLQRARGRSLRGVCDRENDGRRHLCGPWRPL